RQAKEETKKTGLPIERALEKLGFITEDDIASAVAESFNVVYIDLKHYLLNPELTKYVPEPVAKKHKVIPLFVIGNALTIATSEPGDIVALDEIRAASKLPVIETVYSTEKDIQKAFDQLYGVTGNVDDIVKGIDKSKFTDLSDTHTTKILEKASEEAPVVKLVNLIITQAVQEKASDIHIEPEENLVRIRFRIDGILHENSTTPKFLHNLIASRVKILAKMDIAETRRPQDGRIEFKVDRKVLDFRVSSFPTIHGENIVMRILDKTSVILGLEDLGFAKKEQAIYEKLIHSPYGIILVTGPTGSGKTTTLYSSLSTINSMEKNIITIEDPVEYELPLIRQTQVNVKAGLTFASGLRSILRQDPNIVMVGEVRDKETADIAIQASLTGHLVLSTLHTNDAPSAITRLIDMGIEPFLVASSVIGILAQRLVRMICPKCKEKYSPTAGELASMGITAEKKSIFFYKGKGCSECKHTGYRGRIGIFELLVITEGIKRLITKKASSEEIKEDAKKEGMRFLNEDGLDKVKNGVTTIEEVLRVTEEL
ncbi:MAG: type II secretion system ATPase GspE, partial [Candidatus Omnitrophica bacterium]|nr:type II secretion system ATPase GspE [Candidatus Omnitrophota bacterium]